MLLFYMSYTPPVQRGNQKSIIEEGHTIQQPREKG